MTDLLEQVFLLEKEADEFGFRWENTEQIMQQIESECVEIREQLGVLPSFESRTRLQEEIGDLLHAVFSLCVFCGENPTETLEKSLIKFEKRLHAVKALAFDKGLTNVIGYPFDELMALWKKAKFMVE